MPHDRPAPLARSADDDTQDDWATDLFAALDEQSEQDEQDEQDELDKPAVFDEQGKITAEAPALLPPDEQRAPYALATTQRYNSPHGRISVRQ